eukprot:COSAG06_NODE_47232_length_340_cov_1.713693_1_plen_42_part_10
MSSEEKAAAKALVWSEGSWNDGDTAAFHTIWNKLTPKQQTAA